MGGYILYYGKEKDDLYLFFNWEELLFKKVNLVFGGDFWNVMSFLIDNFSI